MLKALATKPEYKVRIEVIRQTQPNISLDNLWLSVGRLPYPLESNEVYSICSNEIDLKHKEISKRKRKKRYKKSEVLCVWQKKLFFLSMSR